MKAIEVLKQLAKEENKRKYPNFPDDYRPLKNYKIDTSNGLTRAIVDFLNFSGHYATRINNQGTWVKDRFNKYGGYYRKSTQIRGIADVDALINGKKVAIEIKIGHDRQSEFQKDFQTRIEKAGGFYWIAKDFDQFYSLYLTFVESNPRQDAI